MQKVLELEDSHPMCTSLIAARREKRPNFCETNHNLKNFRLRLFTSSDIQPLTVTILATPCSCLLPPNMFSRRLLNLTAASQRRSSAVRSYAVTSPANATATDRTRQAANPADNFLTAGADTAYFDEMLSAYRQDPESVHVSWRAYFRGLFSDAAR